jgi:hypothetical protein
MLHVTVLLELLVLFSGFKEGFIYVVDVSLAVNRTRIVISSAAFVSI